MNIHKALQSKKYPTFIRSNPITPVFKRSSKIFPLIGLKNFEQKLGKKISEQDVNKITNNLINRIWFTVGRWLCYYPTYNTNYGNIWISIATYSKSRIDLPEAVTDANGKIFAKKGDLLIEVAKKLLAKLRSSGCIYGSLSLKKLANQIDSCQKSLNKLSQYPKYSVVFSADGEKGAWDIATMSMRGITSCMRWSSDHSTSLVGSIVDPCCGVIYLTDGAKTQYGSNMLFRAVVRYVLVKGKPSLFLEPLYASEFIEDGDNRPYESINKIINSIFIEILKKKTGLPVVTNDGSALIPAVKVTDAIISNDYDTIDCRDVEEYSTYSDAELGYGKTFTSTKDIYQKTFLKRKTKSKNVKSKKNL